MGERLAGPIMRYLVFVPAWRNQSSGTVVLDYFNNFAALPAYFIIVFESSQCLEGRLMRIIVRPRHKEVTPVVLGRRFLEWPQALRWVARRQRDACVVLRRFL